MEANPPALPEFLHRDSRWMAGNLQYRHLLFAPGFRPMGRWQMVQAILLFLSAPLYPLMLALAAINAASHGGDVPRDRLIALAVAWPLVIYAPKLLGYLDILLSPAKRARYGGALAFARGAGLEILFTLLLDAIVQPSKAAAMLRVMLGARPRWLPQNRTERGVTWSEAWRQFWPHTLFGVAVFALLLRSSVWAALLALPFAGGLLVAVPFCVATASPGVSAWLKRRRVAATPEELAPPSPE
jgi:membrane glycosyltransferase